MLPITKSVNVTFNSWYQNLTCVREIFGLSSNVQLVTREEKQKTSCYRTKIAHHSLRYI
jgi:hypothetical protein